jgi:CHAD domain-containing protein
MNFGEETKVGDVRRFVVTGAGDFASVVAALTGHLGLRLDASESIDRSWIDTDEGTLFRIGTTLEFRRPVGADRAPTLTWFDEGRILAQHDCVLSTPPETATDLPDSPAMHRLAAAIGDGALVTEPSTISQVALLARLDDEEKTTARILVDRSAMPDGEELPVVLELVPMRGYEDEADALERAMHKLIALESTSSTVMLLARRRAGLGPTPGSDPVLDLDEDLSAIEAWRTALQFLTIAMRDNFEGTLSGEDPESLHAFRVAIRRIRTVLRDGHDVLDPEARDRFREEFRWMGDITTPQRDADVHLLEYPDLVATLPKKRRADLGPFRDVLRDHRSNCHEQLVRDLRSIRRAEFGMAWAEFLADDSKWTGSNESPDSLRPARVVAANRIARAHRRLVKDGRAITPRSPAIVLHDLRKDSKRLRYLFECFGSLFPAREVSRAVKPLRRLQDVLGTFQDCEVQSLALMELADDLVTREGGAPALLAVGAVVDQLEARGSRARMRFAGVFEAYDRSSVRRSVRRLGRTARVKKKSKKKSLKAQR